MTEMAVNSLRTAVRGGHVLIGLIRLKANGALGVERVICLCLNHPEDIPMSELTIFITINRLASYASGNTFKLSFSEVIKQLLSRTYSDNVSYSKNGRCA